MKNNISLVIGIVSVLLCTALFAVLYSNMEKHVFVDAATLFNDFKMKKILEADFKKVQDMRRSQLDSMRLNLDLMERRGDKNDFAALREIYLQKQDEFASADEALTQKYNEQIWNQLNQYVKDYGKAHGYDFIHGITGDGSMMYASEDKDITKDLIIYVNEKFDGTGK